MKFWTWFKGLGLVAIAGAIVTAILMVLGGAKVGRQERRADRAEKQAEALAHDRTKQGIEKAAKLNTAAKKHKDKAATIRKKTEARLQELGDKDETMADIADRFNKRKLRDSAS